MLCASRTGRQLADIALFLGCGLYRFACCISYAAVLPSRALWSAPTINRLCLSRATPCVRWTSWLFTVTRTTGVTPMSSDPSASCLRCLLLALLLLLLNRLYQPNPRPMNSIHHHCPPRRPRCHVLRLLDLPLLLKRMLRLLLC